MNAYTLSRYQQLGWASGSLAMAVMLGSLTSYALFFMTTYLGVSALLAGQIIALSKLYDMLTDPVVAQFSDRTRSRIGRRRPYILAGAVIAPLSLVLLFHAPANTDSSRLLIGLGGILLLYATGYTLFSVPYLAMPAEMTTSPRERTVMMSQRTFFSTIGLLATSVLGPWIIRATGGDIAGYRSMSWVMAALVVSSMLLVYRSTRDAAWLPPSDARHYSFGGQLRLILRNRPFRMYMAAKICMFVSQTAVQGTMLFFARYILGRDEMILAAFGVGYTIGNLVSLPAWTMFISRMTGKRTGFQVSALGLGCVLLTWIFAVPGEAVWLLYARFVLLGVFSAGSMVSGFAMLPDIMEYDRRQTGLNQEGLYAAAFTLVEKVANTVGPAVIGVLLGVTGFVSTSRGEFAEQPPNALLAIRLGVSVVPFLLAVAAALFIRGYDIEEEPPTNR